MAIAVPFFCSYTQYFPETAYISSTKDVTGRFTIENDVSCGANHLHFLHPSVLKRRRSVKKDGVLWGLRILGVGK